MSVGAVENGNVAPVGALVIQAVDFGDDKTGFVAVRVGGVEGNEGALSKYSRSVITIHSC